MVDDAIIIICTRPESTRIPRKAFKKIAGRPAIEHIISRLSMAPLPIVLAVPDGCTEYDSYHGPFVSIFKGSPDSPLHRMAQCIREFNWEIGHIVRVTHDDIIVDAQSMMQLLERCQREEAGYGISKDILEGAGVEVIAVDNLLRAAIDHPEPTEFVSYFVKNNPNGLALQVPVRPEIRRPHYRMTMDYPEDVQVLEIVMRKLGPDATCDEICAYIDQHPWIARLNAQPELTVYTCAYNAERYVARAIESVLANRFDSMEYIFVDDHSTDETLSEVSRFAYRHMRPFRMILNESNIGLASSSNIALAAARGRYVMRLDADDMLRPNALKTLYDKIISEGSAAVYPGYQEIDTDGNLIGQPKDPRLSHHVGGALFNTRFLNEIRFKNNLRRWDGRELYERMENKFKISYLDDTTFFYRKHGGSLTAGFEQLEQELLKKS